MKAPGRYKLTCVSLPLQVTDLPDQVRLSDLQVGSYVFQLTVTDSNQRSDVARVTVLVLGPETSSCECSWDM